MSEPGVDEEVMTAVRSWRQGDLALGDVEIFFVDDNGDVSAIACHGYLMVSQTCDIVRDAAERPLVEVAALVQVDATLWAEAMRGRRPRYVTLPALRAKSLVADLDQVMSVSKRYIARWRRERGCRDDAEARALGFALARKRGRAAFPDDFVGVIRPLQGHLLRKHDKLTPEGEALRALREIRVRAEPSWEAPHVEVTLFFLYEDGGDVAAHVQHTEGWRDKIGGNLGRFDIDLQVLALEDLSARAYVDSDPLDLDHLSLMDAQRR